MRNLNAGNAVGEVGARGVCLVVCGRTRGQTRERHNELTVSRHGAILIPAAVRSGGSTASPRFAAVARERFAAVARERFAAVARERFAALASSSEVGARRSPVRLLRGRGSPACLSTWRHQRSFGSSSSRRVPADVVARLRRRQRVGIGRTCVPPGFRAADVAMRIVVGSIRRTRAPPSASTQLGFAQAGAVRSDTRHSLKHAQLGFAQAGAVCASTRSSASHPHAQLSLAVRARRRSSASLRHAQLSSAVRSRTRSSACPFAAARPARAAHSHCFSRHCSQRCC